MRMLAAGRSRHRWLLCQAVGLVLLLTGAMGVPAVAGVQATAAVSEKRAEPSAPVVLRPCDIAGTDPSMLCGTHEVFEDRAGREGRKIKLRIVVIPATFEPKKPDPVFLLAGGPGQAATRLARWAKNRWFRDPARDLVLVDQRGTGGSNGLDCDLPGAESDPLTALGALFEDPAALGECRAALERRADLRLYTTPLAMDDLEDVRRALGYGRINVVGGSYGTRAALVYLRRHGKNVRAAVLTAAAPVGYIIPLHHARGAQRSLDLILQQCAADPACHRSYPRVREELHAVLSRLEKEPAVVVVPGGRGPVRITRDAFAEALRLQMYTTRGTRRVPNLVHQAHRGDYEPFVQAGIAAIQGLLRQIDVGLLMSVVCSEEMVRIEPDDIPRMTAGTFIGDARLRTQSSMCALWPRGEVPADYGRPVVSDVPVLVISGSLDPVTSPRWGAEAVRHLSRGRHVVVPRAHDVNTPCVGEIAGAFLHGDPHAPLDTACVDQMELPPFELPD